MEKSEIMLDIPMEEEFYTPKTHEKKTTKERLEETLYSYQQQGRIFVFKRDIFRLLIFTCLGFFWGRGEMLNLFHPLGIAYISLFFGEGIFFWTALVAVGLSAMAVAPLKCGAVLAAAIAIQLTLGRFTNRQDKYKKALLAGFSMALAGIFYAIAQGGLIFYFVVAGIESALAMGISFLAQKGMGFFWEKQQTWVPTREEVLGLLFLFSGALVGIGNVEVPWVQQGILAFLCAYFIGVCANAEGMSGGATAGLVLGFLLYLCSGIDSTAFALLGMAGLLSGSVRDLGKWAMVLVLLISPMLVLFYQDTDAFSSLWIQGWSLGGLGFLLTPKKITLLFRGQAWIQEKERNVYLRKKEMLEEKLLDFSTAFYALGKTFKPLEEHGEKNQLISMVDKIAENTCNGCGVAHYCWEEELYRSYGTTVSALSYCEEKGSITLEQLPQSFQDICVRKELFVAEINKSYENYRRDRLWIGRLKECRELVGQQMNAVGHLLGELSGEMDVFCVFLESANQNVKEVFSKASIPLKEVQVTENTDGSKRQVEIVVKSCGCHGDCKLKLLPLIKESMGRPMQLKEKGFCHCTDKGECRLAFVEVPLFQLTTATACASASEDFPIGDTCSFLETQAGIALMAVSDGMGQGQDAAKESNTAIELLEQFSEAGFQRDLAVKLINSALLLQRGEDSYATLDICAVDLFQGKAQFIKLGAVSSYISRGGRILTITSHTLPAGILEEVEVIENEMLLKDGDIIFMVTDGVTEALGGEGPTAAWLKEKLASRPMSNPQDVATYILQEVKKEHQTHNDDDMTVMAGRFWKKRKGA